MKVEIEKYDNLGRGIAYLDGKIIFIPKSAVGDILLITKVIEKKNYAEGIIKEVIKPSKYRTIPKCPYYNECGGCDLMHVSLSETLDYKITKVNEILKTNNIAYEVKEIIKNKDEYNYRSKITLKVVSGKIGYFISNSHNLLEINNCLITKNVINDVIKYLECLNIYNGEIIIKSNYKDELLIIINSDDEVGDFTSLIENFKISGIVQKRHLLYGDDYL